MMISRARQSAIQPRALRSAAEAVGESAGDEIARGFDQAEADQEGEDRSLLAR